MTTQVLDASDAGLERREVLLLVVARFAGLLGDQVSTFMIPVAVFAATHSTALSGVAFTVQWLPRVVALPVLGMVAERFPMRAQLIAMDLARAAVLAATVWYHAPTGLIIASGFLTLLNGHSVISMETAVARNVSAEAMAEAQAKMQTSQQLVNTAGPALGGAFLAWWPISVCSGVVAAVFVIGGAITAVLVRMPIMRHAPQRSAAAEGPGRRLAAGARVTRRNRPLILLILITCVINLVGGIAMAALPAIIVGELSSSQSSVGVVAGVASLASLGAASLMNVALRLTSVSRIVVLAFAALAGSAPLLGLSSSVVVFGFAYAMWTAAIAVFAVWMRTVRNQLVPKDELGTVLGFFVASVLAPTPVAGLLLAVVGDQLAARSLILVAAAASAVTGVPLWWAWQRIRSYAGYHRVAERSAQRRVVQTGHR